MGLVEEEISTRPSEDGPKINWRLYRKILRGHHWLMEAIRRDPDPNIREIDISQKAIDHRWRGGGARVDGISDFNARGKHDHEVHLYAFDVLAMDGDDLRPLPLSMRKASLAKLLHRRPDGIFTGSFEQGEIGPELFQHACMMGLEGWCQSARIGLTAPAARKIGSR
jgi:hypothetical protein